MTNPQKVFLRNIEFMKPSELRIGDVLHSLLINPLISTEAKQKAATIGIYQSSILLKQELIMNTETQEIWDDSVIPPKNVHTIITTDSGFVMTFVDDRDYLVGVMRTDPYEAFIS